MRVKGEAADHEHVEAHALNGFFGCLLHLLRADSAVLGADGDGDAPLPASGQLWLNIKWMGPGLSTTNVQSFDCIPGRQTQY